MTRLHGTFLIVRLAALSSALSCVLTNMGDGIGSDPGNALDLNALDADADGKVHLKGLVIQNLRGCDRDAACVLKVEISGFQTAVVYHYGEWPPCENTKAIEQGSDAVEGELVEVYAEIVKGGSLDTCPSAEYYIRRLPGS